MEIIGEFAEVIQPLVPVLWPLFALFARLSAFFLLVPVFSERAVPSRVRLGIALVTAFILFPVVEGVAPLGVSEGLVMIATESVTGFAIGLSMKLFIYALQIIGMMMSQALSLTQPLGEGIASEPNTSLSTLMMLAGLTLLVTLDLHVVLIGVLAQSYETLPLGVMMDPGEAGEWLTGIATTVFRLSLSLSLPFIILNFAYNMILGFLNRAMPQLMVSFVGIPGMTLAGLVLLTLSTSAVLLAWLKAFSEFL